ncbi:hypothetical protein SF123566_10408 [Shigella flexneri 1235-66]|nr:hypothetical protein SF123566_10408 [Shigella flexneri 1235-66]
MSNETFHVTERFRNPLSLSINITFLMIYAIIARTTRHIHPDDS